MPGLVGMIHKTVKKNTINTSINKMISLLVHEDSYVTDKRLAQSFALGSIDLAKGDFISQLTEDETCIFGFTGQVYNQELLTQNLSLTTEKDFHLLSLLLLIYKEQGLEALCGLNGLYIVVVWDKQEKRLHIVNDRYGFKKLYYWNTGDKFVFASEYKAISWMPDFPRSIDEFAFANLMAFGYVLNDKTLFKEIKLLPPASILTIKDSKLSINKYWDYSFYEEGDPVLSEDDYVDGFAEKITSAVSKRLRGVKKLALPLSGGLDSRTMAAVIHRLNMVDYVKAYSHGHRHCYDVRFGRQIAKKLGFPHDTLEVSPNFIDKHARAFAYLGEGMTACDWALRLDNKVKVLPMGSGAVLTGFLGDVLCGSDMHFDYPDMSWKRLSGIENEDAAIKRIYRRHIDSFDDEACKRYFSKDIFAATEGHNIRSIQQTYYNAPTDNILNRARYVNLHQRQRRVTSTLVDHYEIFTRTLSPFIDNEFVDFILHVPPDLQYNTHLYKRMLDRHFPEVVNIGHSETGIPITPNRWQAGMKWRKEKHKNLLRKLSFGLYGTHDYNDYRHTADALRTSSREFMMTAMNKNVELRSVFFNVEAFDDLLSAFLNSNSKRYEAVCYPLTFLVWADVFNARYVISRD